LKVRKAKKSSQKAPSSYCIEKILHGKSGQVRAAFGWCGADGQAVFPAPLSARHRVSCQILQPAGRVAGPFAFVSCGWVADGIGL